MVTIAMTRRGGKSYATNLTKVSVLMDKDVSSNTDVVSVANMVTGL